MLLSAPAHLGYLALFGFVFGESAGAPVPGETSLIAAGLLAGSGRLSLFHNATGAAAWGRPRWRARHRIRQGREGRILMGILDRR